ncbi:MAG: hypothetical protein JSW07_03400, partial [bacterium]
VRSAKSIARKAEEEYRRSVIKVLKASVLEDAKKNLQDIKNSIPKDSFRRAKDELDETKKFIDAQKDVEFVIGDLVAEVNARIQRALTFTDVQQEIAEFPDLVFDELVLSPEIPKDGEDFVINAVIRNIGRGSAERILVLFLTCDDREIGRATIEYLETGHLEEVTITTVAQEPGECVITARIDPDNRIAESNEQNNEVQKSFAVEFPFIEKYPAWNTPDLAVKSLTVDPDRANPGESINLRTVVVNEGTGAARNAELVYLVDGIEIAREPVDPLEPGAEVDNNIMCIAEGSGRHEVAVQLELAADGFECSSDNNLQTAMVRVSGTEFPEPELEVAFLGFNSDPNIPGEPHTFNLNIRNPSFTEVQDIPVEFHVDGEHVSNGTIQYLAPGEEQELQFPRGKITPGEHMVVVKMDLPDEFPYADIQRVKSFHVINPDQTVLCDTYVKDMWVSLGPRRLTNGSTGRMDAIAFHPNDPNIMYAGAPTGGLWKTTNGGKNWTPLTDKLPSMQIGAVAVDPKYPNIIYLGTGSSRYKKGIGIFKSIDGGKHWTRFATHGAQIISWQTTNLHPILGVSRLVIRYPKPGTDNVLIYAATNCGLLRYKSNNPQSTKSCTTNEWIQILPGVILDMAVSHNDASVVYASVNYYKTIGKKKKEVYKGLFRTRNGETALATKPYVYWDWLKNGLPNYTGKEGYRATLDIFRADPKILYTAIRYPGGGITIYSTKNEGDSWKAETGLKDIKNEAQYNPFIRINPNNHEIIYFGGVKLYRATYLPKYKDPGMQNIYNEFYWSPVKVYGIHDDMQGMEFVPSSVSSSALKSSGTYYILTDGGIYRSYSQPTTPNYFSYDAGYHLNKDLCTIQFYDFDVSRSKPDLMIGGTQDNGTILYDGNPDWCEIKTGDGNFSLIAPGNKILYAQHQYLHDDYGTNRCEHGLDCVYKNWQKAKNGLPKEGKWYSSNAYMTVHPMNPKYLLSQGEEVHATWDAGEHWVKKGPKGKNVKGFVKRVVFQPKTHYWFAGTNKGQIWYTKNEGGYWELIDSHYDATAWITCMSFAPTNHNVLYVTYRGCQPYRRIQRLEMNAKGEWNGTWITDNLPIKHVPAGTNLSYISGNVPVIDKSFVTNVKIHCIAADGYSDLVAYVGTDKGVFRGEAVCGTCIWNWKPYNNGLPLVIVKDLLVDPKSKQLRAATFGRGAWGIITGP